MTEKITGVFSDQYLLAIALFTGIFLGIRIIFLAAGRFIAAPPREAGEAAAKRSSGNFSKALTILALFIALPVSAGVLPGEKETLLALINKTSHTFVSIALAYVVYTAVDRYLSGILNRMVREEGLGDSLKPVFRSILKILLGIFVLVYILGAWGVQVAPMLAGLGIGGLALALALQPLLGNFFNGMALVLDGTLKNGDVVKLGSGEMGSVFRVGLRTTKIKTFDNEMFIIPNTRLADSIIQNFFQPDKSVRVGVDFGVEYGTDPEYVKQITLEEVNKISFIDKSQQARVLFSEMTDYSLNFRTLFWVDDISRKWPAHQEAISRIYRRLYEENIGIPFPQRTVWMRDEGQTRPPSPTDEKFKTVRGKYFPNFGYEYIEEPPGQEKK